MTVLVMLRYMIFVRASVCPSVRSDVLRFRIEGKHGRHFEDSIVMVENSYIRSVNRLDANCAVCFPAL